MLQCWSFPETLRTFPAPLIGAEGYATFAIRPVWVKDRERRNAASVDGRAAWRVHHENRMETFPSIRIIAGPCADKNDPAFPNEVDKKKGWKERRKKRVSLMKMNAILMPFDLFALWWVSGRPSSAGACRAGQLEPAERAVWCRVSTIVRRRRCTSCRGSIRLSAPNVGAGHPADQTLNYYPASVASKEVDNENKALSIVPPQFCEKKSKRVIYTWNTRELSASEPLSSTVSELLLLALPSTPMLPGDLGVFGVCGSDCNGRKEKKENQI